MEIVGIIILGTLGFVFFGILGWVIKIFGYIFEFLFDGCAQSFGCLFWVILIICILLVL